MQAHLFPLVWDLILDGLDEDGAFCRPSIFFLSAA